MLGGRGDEGEAVTVVLFSNLLSGNTGLDKSLVMTANQLHRRGYDLAVLNFVGPGDGSEFLMPRWPVDTTVPVLPLQTLAASGGRRLYENFHPTIKDRIPNLNFAFTENHLCALRELNAGLSDTDVIIFTHPLQAEIFQRAIDSDERRVRTVMQIHGDYKVRHPELGPMLHDARSVVDQIQIVSRGMAADYEPVFGADRVTWIPNIHDACDIPRRAHEGVNVVLVGSFQDPKNQIDAVRMLDRIDNDDVRLTLWGNHATAYGNHVRTVVDSFELGSRVRLPGIGSEAEIYGEADIVIIPSRSEGFGYALVEAAAHGLPVVAYDYDYGPRDAIEDGESGYIVTQGDVDALAERVARLAESPELRDRLGRRAREIFERDFAPAPVVERYESLLGPPTAPDTPIIDRFLPDGEDPVPATSIRTRDFVFRGKVIGHLVTFESDRRLRRFRIASGVREKSARAIRVRGRYRLLIYRGDPGRDFRRARQRVVSYATRDRQAGRFYLGNTTNGGVFETAQYLRRSRADDESEFEVRNGVLSLARDPRYPATSGSDSFGLPLNTPEGVALQSTGSVTDPRVSLYGEFDHFEIADARRTRTFRPPYGYREMFERVCQSEQDYALFDRTVADDIHPWELYRAAFLASLSEALGYWGPQFKPATVPTLDLYDGGKSLERAKHHRRVLFEFPRKPDGIDHRTAALHDDDTMIIEYPQSFGYGTAVYTHPNHYPIREYNLWRRGVPDLPTVDIDPRPFEEALSATLEFPVVLGGHLTNRVRKFLEERAFWTPIFEAVEPKEVIIPSSHWSAGICAAARRAGAQAADIQYALTSRLHPSYWFGQRPAHGADLLYAWSPFWAERTNAYLESKIVPRGLWDPNDDSELATDYDFCVVSQPRVFRRIVRFTESLAKAHPNARICVAPHPDEREAFERKLQELDSLGNIEIAPTSTLNAIRRSRIVLGGYSTSMYEAAALGKPTYVIPLPGAEIAMDDVETGLFRIANDVNRLDAFELPAFASDIFATSAS